MRVTARPIAPGEIDYELVTLAASLGGLGLAAAWFALHLPWPICVFHALTGQPCLSCGMTRSAISFFHAQFFTAWKWNPLAFTVYCSIAMVDAYAFVVLITRAPRLRACFTAPEKSILRAVVITAILVNWVYLLAHARMFNS
jgi:Protein of unknown function (DUF2752)